MRVKRGVTSRARHNKIRKATKGFSHPNRVSIKRGRQAVIKSMQNATRDRKNRKRTFRETWNTRTYSKLIAALKAANITVDRKIMAELAVNEPAAFTAVVNAAIK
jgi:large subunit ribosomal protein L20